MAHSLSLLLWLITAVSFPIGGTAAFAVFGRVSDPARGLGGGLITGGVIGVAQWLVLRQTVAVGPVWIAATAAGLGVGLALGIAAFGAGTELVPLLARAACAGLVIGVLQWMVLRPAVPGSLWWVLVVAAGWEVGWAVTRAIGVDLSKGWTVFGSSGAVAFALLSGLAMLWLLGRR
jgi:hypothetical protein